MNKILLYNPFMAEFIEYEENTGKINMEIDSEILESAIKNEKSEPVIRFYGWKPKCVSLGRNQSSDDINIEYCKRNNIDIVRRVTGGRALLHDSEITYSFVCPSGFLNNGESVIASYKEISAAIILGFKNLGINLEIGSKKQVNTSFSYCMSLITGADLCVDGRKLIGSAQFRKQNYILQHGSVLMDFDSIHIDNIFKEKEDYDSITTVKRLNEGITGGDVIESLKRGFKNYFNLN